MTNVTVRIDYGIEDKYVDITKICQSKCIVWCDKQTNINYVSLPSTDVELAQLFGDPVYGKLKHIKVSHGDNIFIYIENDIKVIPLNLPIGDPNYTYINTNSKWSQIVSKLQLRDNANFNEEKPEQLMACQFIKPNDVVLEIGGNIGRNSLVIASILNSPCQQQLTLECSQPIYYQLLNNRNDNKLMFQAEQSALSIGKLMQRGWDTFPINDQQTQLPEGFTWVNTVTYQQLLTKYPMNFTTLVADCEGSLFYIFKDFPTLLDHTQIHTVIMENDYHNANHKNFVDDFMVSKGFKVVYNQSGGWGVCYPCFFQVWKRI